MMDYLDVPFECHNLVYCTVVSHLRQWLVESTVSSVEGAKCGLSVVQTCVHIAKVHMYIHVGMKLYPHVYYVLYNWIYGMQE